MKSSDSPAAASRFSTASWNACATSSAWNWCMGCGAEARESDLLAGGEGVPDGWVEISQWPDRRPAGAADVAGLEHGGDGRRINYRWPGAGRWRPSGCRTRRTAGRGPDALPPVGC